MWNLTLKKIIDCETINVSGFWKNIEIFWATGSKYRQNKTKEKSKDTDKEQRLFEVKKRHRPDTGIYAENNAVAIRDQRWDHDNG